jgi:hypothetical protein
MCGVRAACSGVRPFGCRSSASCLHVTSPTPSMSTSSVAWRIATAREEELLPAAGELIDANGRRESATGEQELFRSVVVQSRPHRNTRSSPETWTRIVTAQMPCELDRSAASDTVVAPDMRTTTNVLLHCVITV